MPNLGQSMARGSSNQGKNSTDGNTGGIANTNKTRNGTSSSSVVRHHHHSRHPAQVFYAQGCTAKKVKQTPALSELLGFGVVWAEMDDMGMDQLEVLRSLVSNTATIALSEIHLACGLKHTHPSAPHINTNTRATQASITKNRNTSRRIRLGLPRQSSDPKIAVRQPKELLNLSRALRTGLTSSTLLTRLELIGTCLTVADSRALASGIRASTSLRFVSVQGSRCGDAAFVSLAAAVGDNGNINDVCFNGCSLSDSSSVHITSMLRKHAQRRNGERWTQSLRDVPATTSSAATVTAHAAAAAAHDVATEAAIQLNGLVVLDLSQNRLGDSTAKDVVHALRFDDWIAAINLSSNRITADGASAVLHLVERPNSHLVCVDLRNNDPTASAVVGQVDRCMKEGNASEQRLQPGRQNPETIEVVATTLFRWESGHQLDAGTRDVVAGVTGHTNSLGMSCMGLSGVGSVMGASGKRRNGADHDTKATLMSASFRRWVNAPDVDVSGGQRNGSIGVDDVAKWHMGDAPRVLSGLANDDDDSDGVHRRIDAREKERRKKKKQTYARGSSQRQSHVVVARTSAAIARERNSGKKMEVLNRAHETGKDEEEEEDEWAGYSRDDLDAFANELLGIERDKYDNINSISNSQAGAGNEEYYSLGDNRGGVGGFGDNDDGTAGSSETGSLIENVHEQHGEGLNGGGSGGTNGGIMHDDMNVFNDEADVLRQSMNSTASSRSDATRFLVTFKHELKVAMSDAATKTHNHRVAAVLRQTVDTLDSLMPTDKLLALTDNTQASYMADTPMTAAEKRGLASTRQFAVASKKRQSKTIKETSKRRTLPTHDNYKNDTSISKHNNTSRLSDERTADSGRHINKSKGDRGKPQQQQQHTRNINSSSVRPHAYMGADSGSARTLSSDFMDDEAGSSAADEDRSLYRNFLDLDLHGPTISNKNKVASSSHKKGASLPHNDNVRARHRSVDAKAEGHSGRARGGGSGRARENGGGGGGVSSGGSNPVEYQEHVNEIASQVSDRLRSLWNMS